MRIDASTGEVLGGLRPCGSWAKCPGCAQRKAEDVTQRLQLGILDAIERGHDVHLVTLTNRSILVSVAEARRRFKLWRKRLGRRGGILAYAAVAHVDGRGSVHLHALIVGPFVPVDVARQHAVAAGWGQIMDVRRVGSMHEDAARLAMYLGGPLRKAYNLPSGGRQIRPAVFSTNWPRVVS